jgi:hypothetical protein
MKEFEIAGLQRFAHPKMDGANLDIEQAAMLANNVEVMQRPERVVSPEVRLERKQLCAILVWQFFQKRRPAKSRLALGNREINLTLLNFQAMPPHQRHCENVDTAAERVDIRADLNTEGERQQLLFKRYYWIVCSRRRDVSDFDRDIDA